LVIAVTRLKTNPFIEEVMNYENEKKNSLFVAANNEFILGNVSKKLQMYNNTSE
jgi:hypothetical protein